jgi:hypothetical protein
MIDALGFASGFISILIGASLFMTQSLGWAPMSPRCSSEGLCFCQLDWSAFPVRAEAGWSGGEPSRATIIRLQLDNLIVALLARETEQGWAVLS